MRSKADQDTLNEINKLFSLAEKNKSYAKRYITLARTIAKRHNVRLPLELRRKFCHKCNSLLDAKNKKVRISHSKISIKCLVCGYVSRIKIKS